MNSSRPILIVGFGSIGKRHFNNLLSITDSPIIIFSKRTKLTFTDLSNYKKLKNRIKVFSVMEQCLEEKPYVAFITNETSLHMKYALKLAKEGIDLFIEKPLSDSLRYTTNLQRIVKKNKLIVMVGCNFRFYPPIRTIKDMLVKKLIGKIISVQSENGSFLPDWHPKENYSNGYAARRNLGGGVTLTQIHELDYLTWMFGSSKTHKGFIGKFSDLRIDADDLCASILKLKNDIIIELHLDYYSRPFYKRLKIRGTKGILYWNSEENKIKVFYNKSKKWKELHIKNNYKLTDNVNQMYYEEIQYFLDCCKKRNQPMNNLAESINVLTTVLDLKNSSLK